MRALSPTLGVDPDGVGDSVHEAACACCAYACDMHMQGPCPTLPPWGPTKPSQLLHASFGAIFRCVPCGRRAVPRMGGGRLPERESNGNPRSARMYESKRESGCTSQPESLLSVKLSGLPKPNSVRDTRLSEREYA